MLSVFVNAHAVEFVGAVGFADALHEFGGLLLFAFRLLAGDFFRHRFESKAIPRWSKCVCGLIGRFVAVFVHLS